ncbi:hypothetical protein BGX31_002917 [Mortierella sp. GBA43]|nr:hypothetical protein BGX31_002917 [Mortierella sp. GBA43]
MKDFGNAISLTAQTARPIDPSRVCGYMTQALQSIADALENIPELPVRKLDILPEHERHLLIETWNATKMGFLEDKCIHHLVEVQSRQTPQAIALVFGNQTITYVEMNVRANQLAHRLIDLGVRPDTRVAICVERSASMIIAVLAVLKAGGAYVPLDPTYPNDRLACILEDSRPEVIIVDDMGRSVMEGIGHQSNQDGYEGRTAIPILDLNEELTTSTSNPRVYGLTSRHLCYVIYTSGSTGKPKGVMIEHQGVVNFVTSRLQDWGLEASGQVLQFSSLNFDLSVMETFGCFFSGATLHILPDSIRLDRRELWSYLERHSITLTILPPAILQDCKDLEPLSAPLTLVSCGDALPPSLLRLLQPLVPHGSIINEYGPTETAISDIAWRCPDNFNGDLVPIGRPMGNKRVYILDRNGLPVPLGAIGDLYIGGVGVARGYLNKPELTAQVFVPNPFDGHPEARMYKTGDLARYLPDGNIVFLGRNDFQVKIRGFRIELGEIEARLEDHALVEKSVVLAVGNGNERRLVSYVVSQPVDGLVQTLHSHLVSCLPDYMIPSAIVRLESFPLNSNGKLDRKAFPAPGSDAFALRAYEEPQGTIEVAIAQIWIDLLHLDRVGRSDNFFTLGGHSLLAVRLMNRVASFGVQLPLSAIFATPCLSSFAYVMAKHLTKGITSLCSLPDITTTPRDGYLPPSFSQEYMWTVSQLEGVNDTYHVPLAVRFRGDLHRDALQRAMDTIFARHEALRSTFVTVDGDLQVQILSAQSGIPTHWEDLRGRPDAEVQLKELSKSEIWTPFDLARGPLIRALVVHLDGNEHVFMLIQHHIITDGWSISILQRELSTLYTSYCRGETNPLPPLSIQYPDYASWQRKQFSGDWLEDQRSYWHANLKDAPELLYLPTDRPRPPQQSFAGGHIPVRIDAELTGPLKKFTLDHGMTLYMTILAAWSTVLSRLSGQDDIVIGSLTANRNHHQVESLLGFFVNTLALRIDLSGEPTVGQLIERVKQTTLGAQSNQDVPFQEIVDHVQPHHGPSHAPLFQVLLVWHNNETSKWNLPLLEEQDAEATLRSTEFDLELSLYETDHEIAGNITYSTALFDRETIENHVEYLHLALQELIVDTERPMTTIGIVA